MSLADGFNMILSLAKIDAQLINRAGTAVSLSVAKSNVDAKRIGIEENTFEGKEFIVSIRELERVAFGIPKRGDRIITTEFGSDSIDRVIPQIVLGAIVGYRLRTA